MYKIISFEEACNTRNLFNKDITSIKLYQDAQENSSCRFLLGLSTSPPKINILVKDDTLGEGVVGFLIAIYSKDISVYIAKDYNGDIIDGPHILDFDLDASLNNIIDKSKIQVNRCPVCNKVVPYQKQKQFSFAGRCCEECLPNMKAIHEKPGWYN